MGKELTPEQRRFIETYIAGNIASEKSRIISAYQDYLRRADKVRAALDKIRKLNVNQALLPVLEQQLKGAETKAMAGDFAAAYEDLLSVKNTAKAGAKGTLAEYLPEQLEEDIKKLEWGVDAALTYLTMSRNQ